MRFTSKEIANANDIQTIREDWKYLEHNAVPMLNETGFLEMRRLEDAVMIILKNKLG